MLTPNNGNDADTTGNNDDKDDNDYMVDWSIYPGLRHYNDAISIMT